MLREIGLVMLQIICPSPLDVLPLILMGCRSPLTSMRKIDARHGILGWSGSHFRKMRSLTLCGSSTCGFGVTLKITACPVHGILDGITDQW